MGDIRQGPKKNQENDGLEMNKKIRQKMRLTSLRYKARTGHRSGERTVKQRKKEEPSKNELDWRTPQ